MTDEVVQFNLKTGKVLLEVARAYQRDNPGAPSNSRRPIMSSICQQCRAVSDIPAATDRFNPGKGQVKFYRWTTTTGDVLEEIDEEFDVYNRSQEQEVEEDAEIMVIRSLGRWFVLWEDC